MKARAEAGPFKSLADICDRIDSRLLNKRALEALIHCGALDKIQINRQQGIKDLELLVDWAQSRARDRDSGQGNLFDLLGGGNGGSAQQARLEIAPKAPTIDDYAPQERLRLEKELLGFYISDHPLKSLRESSRMLAPIQLGSIKQHVDRTVCAIVMVAAVKNVITKKGDAMAIIQVEDLTGQTEAVVFPKSYLKIGHLMNVDARIMVWGKVDKRDEDQFQFIIDDAEAIEDVKMVMVEIAPTMAEDAVARNRLQNILRTQNGEDRSGKISVVAIVESAGQKQIVRFGNQFRVKDDRATVNALKQAGFTAHSSPLISA
jgi:DNA polymerase III subunit alpha